MKNRKITSETIHNASAMLIQEMMEDERAEYYDGQHHYETDFYFTVFMEPPQILKSKITNIFIDDAKSEGKADMKAYLDTVEKFMGKVNLNGNMLSLWFPDIALLSDEEALSYLEKARALYEKLLPPDDPRLGGLYNNTGLVLTDLSRFEEALTLYEKALAVMRRDPAGRPEEAITHLNMADTLTAQLGSEAAESAVTAHLDEALRLLSDPGIPKNGYYAFVCEKCAPVFGAYGYCVAAADLARWAKEIYERP